MKKLIILISILFFAGCETAPIPMKIAEWDKFDKLIKIHNGTMRTDLGVYLVSCPTISTEYLVKVSKNPAEKLCGYGCPEEYHTVPLEENGRIYNDRTVQKRCWHTWEINPPDSLIKYSIWELEDNIKEGKIINAK